MAQKRKDHDLEAALGYSFKNQVLFKRALTHASMRIARRNGGSGSSPEVRADNERLEFLGDRVLGLVIAQLLWETDRLASEGELARRFNHLVRREACAEVARQIDLGAYLKMSASEQDSGGRDKDTILGDACEGLLGAIFVEAGFDVAREVVLRLWSPLVDGMPSSAVDPKSQLQEWAQGQGRPLPVYVELSRTGPDHAPVFVAEVRIEGLDPAIGEGANKRAAEQSAAEVLLTREGVRSGDAE